MSEEKELLSPFEKWFEEVKKLAKSDFNFSDNDLANMGFEFEYWEEMFEKGLTPNQALLEDQDAE